MKKRTMQAFNHLKIGFDHIREFIYPKTSQIHGVNYRRKNTSGGGAKQNLHISDENSMMSFDVSLAMPLDNESSNS
jgi:hypothetical protein